MSLINDALKRASQAQPPPPPTAAPPPPLQPVLYAPPSKSPIVILPLLFLAVLALGIWFLVKGWEVAQHLYSTAPAAVAARKIQNPETNPVVAGPTHAESARPNNVVRDKTVSPAPRSGPVASAAPPVSGALSVPPALVTSPASHPTNFPELRLQAIFYRPSRPEVVLNGKALQVGQSISGAKIISINQSTVVLEWNSQTRELSIH